MNPILKTLLILFLSFLLIIVINFLIGPSGDLNFQIFIYGIYAMPSIGILSFVIFILMNKKWTKENRKSFIIFVLILFIWLLLTVLYINSLFG
jgi:hypothetical protein